MALSSRMQNLKKLGLSRNPTVSRGTFHEAAAQMMRKDGKVTKSVEKALKQTGLYHGRRNLTKREFEKGIRKFSEHIQQKEGTKETRFAKDIKRSLRTKKGLIKGSAAEKIFKADVEKQLSSGQPTEMDRETRNRLRTKLMQGEKLTNKDLEGVPDEELDQLKNMVEALKSIHQRERAEEIEQETKEQTDEGKIHEETSVSAAAREDKEKKSGQDDQSSKRSGSSVTVPLQGGLRTKISPENLERFSTKIEANLPAKKESSTEEPSDTPAEEKKPLSEENESVEPPDMEID